MSWRITRAAKADLLEVGRFAEQHWGATQRRQYLTLLESAFRRITDYPRIGKRCDEIRKGYYQLVVRRHVIFCRLGDDGRVEIIRVLRQSMSVDHFWPVG